MLKLLKYIFGTIALIVLGVVLAVALKMYQTPPWGDYFAPDKSFEAIFPEAPVHEVGPAPFPFVGERQFLTSHTNLATYRICYVNITPGIKGPGEAMMADCASTLGGKIELDGNAAAISNLAGGNQSSPQTVDFHVALDNGSIVYGRTITTKTKVYHLLVSHPFRQANPADVRLFFDGFKLKAF